MLVIVPFGATIRIRSDGKLPVPLLQGGRSVENVEIADHNVEGLDVDGGVEVKVRVGGEDEKVVPDEVNSGELVTAISFVLDLKVENVDDTVEISGRIVEVGKFGDERSSFLVENMDSILDISGRKVEKVGCGVEISGCAVENVVGGDAKPCCGPVGKLSNIRGGC